eukprot:1689198-Alexandrium_andersonii.AAC.1
MSASLVGSEMCIRDRASRAPIAKECAGCGVADCGLELAMFAVSRIQAPSCLLYTSDAADDM